MKHEQRTSFRELIANCPLPRHELWPLLESASGQTRETILARDEALAEPGAVALFQHWLTQRAQGMPIAYLIGEREFYGRPFWVNPHTLIPRIDTELLIDKARELASQSGHGMLCDLGTGSGCIAITLALELPGSLVHACDQSTPALQMARNNAAWLGVSDRVRFYQGSWWQALHNGPSRFHGIVSNPPYVRPADPHLQQGDLRFEPRLALADAVPSGLGHIQDIVAGAPDRLEPNGFLLIEHGFDQQRAVMEIFQRCGLVRLAGLSDLSGQPRAVLGFQPA